MAKETSDKGEVTFVHRFARALAQANGHSHPDEHADKVAAAYIADRDQAQQSGGESGDKASSGGEA